MERQAIARWAACAGLVLDPAQVVSITGKDPIFDTAFPIGEGAAVALALVGQAANRLGCLRGQRSQELSVDVRHAAASLLSFALLALDGAGVAPFEAPVLSAFFPCQGGRWIHLHAGFDEGRHTLKTLGLSLQADWAEITAFTSRCDAFELEDRLASLHLCGAVARSWSEWTTSSQGRWLAGRSAVEIVRLGDAPPEALPEGPRPMSDVRVLDLTRVLAGPTCARSLAEHGADVLHVTAPGLPTFDRFEMDTGHGKRQAYLDLNDAYQAQQVRGLVSDCDVFSQSYRLGALARRGLGPAEVAALRPGVVYVSETCYGHDGPWALRPGWEQLAQTATGIAVAQNAAAPALVPVAFTDYTTGYLAAAGVMEALRRRATEGGSWHVRVSLAQTSLWVQHVRSVRDRAQATGLGDVTPWLQSRQTPYGRMTFLGPALHMSETMPYWELPSAPVGSGMPVWASPR